MVYCIDIISDSAFRIRTIHLEQRGITKVEEQRGMIYDIILNFILGGVKIS